LSVVDFHHFLNDLSGEVVDDNFFITFPDEYKLFLNVDAYKLFSSIKV
jgi:hypothetical protein